MSEKLNEPKWKNDLVKRIWKYAMEEDLLEGQGKEHLPLGLGMLVIRVRDCCDRCGLLYAQGNLSRYQCCWVHTEQEDYCPELCDACHNELKKQRPHETVSV